MAPRFRWTAIALLLFAVGCAPKYYVPNTHNVPLLEGRGDVSAALAVGDSRTELLGAYAITDRLGVMLNTAFYEQPDDSTGDGGRGGLLEVGLGWRHSLADNVRYEVYGLLGGGDLENHFPSTLSANPGTTGIIEANLGRVALQQMLAYTSDHFDVAGSLRVSQVVYTDVRGDLVFGGDDQVAYLSARDRHTLVEPAITTRFGGETVKLQLQLGRSFNLDHSDFRQDDAHLTAGVVWTPRRGSR